MVRVTGLEPAHQLTLDPKSSASANSATPANWNVLETMLEYNNKKSLICQELIYRFGICGFYYKKVKIFLSDVKFVAWKPNKNVI